MPYCKTCDTFRAASRMTRRTGLRTPSFVSFNKHSIVPAGFISKLCPERRPARIQDGLRHLGFCEFNRVHVADDDQTVSTNDLGGLFVKMMFSRVRDLGVDDLDTTLVVGTLSLPKLGFVFPIVAERRDHVAVAARRQRLQTEVNPDASIAGRAVFGNIALKRNIPAPASILDKSASLEDAFDLTGLPEPEPTLKVDCGILVDFDGSRNKRNPAESTLRTAACSKPRADSFRVSRCGELSADRTNRIGMNPKLNRASRAKINQVKGGRPANSTPSYSTRLSFALNLTAIVPNLI